MSRSPVLLLTFNRPDFAGRSAAAIANSRPTHVFHASDGPRNDDDRVAVERTRATAADALDGVCPVTMLYRESNLGCRRAVETAISWFFEHVEEGVILEDDCVPGLSFFDFCDEMLRRYRDDERVMHVSGYHHGDPRPGRYLFSQYPRVWGWATWRRAWILNDALEPLSPSDRSALRRALDGRAQARHYLGKFDEVAEGRLDTWDFGWVHSLIANRGLAVQPLFNLVQNIGWGDPRAAHTTRGREAVNANMATNSESAFEGPRRVFPDYEYDRAQFTTFGTTRRARMLDRLPSMAHRGIRRAARWR